MTNPPPPHQLVNLVPPKWRKSWKSALQHEPQNIHWPTPDEPYLSFPVEYTLTCKTRRRQGIIELP